jgi:hypothetical protein
MNQSTHLLSLNIDSETAVAKVIHRLAENGLEVMRSFDLQAARAAHTCCTCPHHGTEQCDCQMIVLLVYDRQSGPLTLVAHGYNGQTHFLLAEAPNQDWECLLKTLILQVLASEGLAMIQQGRSNLT